jgi:ketosteroid isomerase-like protein
MRRALAITMFLSVPIVATLSAQTATSDEQAIRQQIQRLDNRERGLYTQDSIFWTGAYVRPLVGLEDKGEEVRGELQLANRVPNSGTTKTTPVRIEVAKSGDLAYEFNNSEFTYQLKTGRKVTSRASGLRVWKKVDGQWKVAASFSRPHADQPGVANRPAQ